MNPISSASCMRRFSFSIVLDDPRWWIKVVALFLVLRLASQAAEQASVCKSSQIAFFPVFLVLWVSLCRLFALRTAYSNTFEASVLSVLVDFVCRSLNRGAFFSSVAGFPALVGGLLRPVVASDSSASLFCFSFA
ncbi:unnamed protein product [Arabidopsis lyrata]|nr:unnamed protein product [Arabidopsis lyrata]